MSESFSGIWVPLITPFTAQGQVDVAALVKLTQRLVNAGIAGLVVCGTTGEPAALNQSEKALVLETVLQHCAGLSVAMGVSSMTPTDLCAQINHWNHYPLAGYLIPPPYYLRPTQQGVIDFYAEAAQISAHDIIVYDIPYRTGVTLELTTLRTLATMPLVRAVKDCGGDLHKTQALIADGQLQILSGEDHNIFITLCLGGSGAIAASAHLHPECFVAMYQAIQRNDLNAARQRQQRLIAMIDALFTEPNPSPLKAVLHHLGMIEPYLRKPMTMASTTTANRAIDAYQGAQNL